MLQRHFPVLEMLEWISSGLSPGFFQILFFDPFSNNPSEVGGPGDPYGRGLINVYLICILITFKHRYMF